MLREPRGLSTLLVRLQSAAATGQPWSSGAQVAAPQALVPSAAIEPAGHHAVAQQASVQYVQLADGSIQAFRPAFLSAAPSQAAHAPMSATGRMDPSSDRLFAQQPGPAAASTSSAADRPNGQVPLGGQAQRSEPSQTHSHAPSRPLSQGGSRSSIYHAGSNVYQADPLRPPQQPVAELEPAVGAHLDPSTLFIDEVPGDMTKRELAHIFRPFGGFKVRCSASAHQRCTPSFRCNRPWSPFQPLTSTVQPPAPPKHPSLITDIARTKLSV